MKTVIILGDGMSDHPVKSLGGRTPLMAAKKPNIDRIAREGRVGLFKTIPDGMAMGSDVANLSVLGYDPAVCMQGRAVLEAASMGVALDPSDVALRLNLIAAEGGRIKNHSSGHISTEESSEIVAQLDRELGQGRGAHPVTIHPGVSYRHLLVLRGWGETDVDCAPPHDHVGGSLEELLPRARSPKAKETADRLVELYRRALPILEAHPINLNRRRGGKDTADAIWPWSPGHKPRMQTLQDRFGVWGAVISAVDLVMGLGYYAGLEIIRVPGATGLHDTNYEGKAAACLDALADHDLVYVHVEATDEAGHSRDVDLKVRCIEYLDGRLVGPIMEGIAARGIEAIVAVLPDHPTPVETGNHGSDPVPVAILAPGAAPDAVQGFDEVQAARGSLGLLEGDAFIRLALGRP
jgi:2,3-bisphosphoglycerate-independent phosphoglycerate mutase